MKAFLFYGLGALIQCMMMCSSLIIGNIAGVLVCFGFMVFALYKMANMLEEEAEVDEEAA